MSGRDTWVVGRLIDPQESDRDAVYDCDLKAINVASEMSADEPDEVFAVWNGCDEAEWIFVQGEQYRRM